MTDQQKIQFVKNKPWDENDNSIWLASTVSLHRNIEKFKFPIKLEADRQKQIIAMVSKDFLSSSQIENPKLILAQDISPIQKEYLVEHFLSPHSFHQAHIGEAFVLDSTGEFYTTLNIQDHIRFNLIDSKGELESMWNKLVTLEMNLGKTISYAFSPKYGFLTSNFNECGTGLSVSVFLQLSGLIHSDKIDDVLEKLNDESVTISGIQGNPTEIIGDILMIRNNYTLGVTEENILALIRSFTTKLMVEEKSIRSKIMHEESAEIKDKVARAFGILIHSYQIEAIEALNAISLIKLGLELGWVKGISLREINKLFLNCRRAHLLNQFENVKQEDLLHKRAEFIHKALKDVQLTI